MTISLFEAILLGSIDQHEQITMKNTTGAAVVKNEVFVFTNDTSKTIGVVAAGDIANGGVGEAFIKGEFSFKKRTGITFDALDDMYWAVGHNEVVDRATAKTGDFFIAKCTKAAASADTHCQGRIGEPMQNTAMSASSSISVSVSSSSVSTSSSSVSTSSSSVSTSVSVSASPSSSSISDSISSNSDSSSSTSVSSSSTSVSSSSTSVSVSVSSSLVSQSISSNSDSSTSISPSSSSVSISSNSDSSTSSESSNSSSSSESSNSSTSSESSNSSSSVSVP